MTITRLGAFGWARECGGGDRVQGTAALRCCPSQAAIPVKANVQLFAVPVGDAILCGTGGMIPERIGSRVPAPVKR